MEVACALIPRVLTDTEHGHPEPRQAVDAALRSPRGAGGPPPRRGKAKSTRNKPGATSSSMGQSSSATANLTMTLAAAYWDSLSDTAPEHVSPPPPSAHQRSPSRPSAAVPSHTASQRSLSRAESRMGRNLSLSAGFYGFPEAAAVVTVGPAPEDEPAADAGPARDDAQPAPAPARALAAAEPPPRLLNSRAPGSSRAAGATTTSDALRTLPGVAAARSSTPAHTPFVLPGEGLLLHYPYGTGAADPGAGLHPGGPAPAAGLGIAEDDSGFKSGSSGLRLPPVGAAPAAARAAASSWGGRDHSRHGAATARPASTNHLELSSSSMRSMHLHGGYHMSRHMAMDMGTRGGACAEARPAGLSEVGLAPGPVRAVGRLEPTPRQMDLAVDSFEKERRQLLIKLAATRNRLEAARRRRQHRGLERRGGGPANGMLDMTSPRVPDAPMPVTPRRRPRTVAPQGSGEPAVGVAGALSSWLGQGTAARGAFTMNERFASARNVSVSFSVSSTGGKDVGTMG